ncbi:CNDP dipeptidase [Gonapodya prolifera JEL478]|uniref:CNDP dipeptidase n=1 Tax=Gonapodya prolifera (strain JEL478) TaxID=1344416 RepID=A0A139AGP2_GONPJ|nr:CNDP dipeptidase [Gonapodya prolifera JEL478]|eukprot:KXS15981.1 CNDP dipeptidase [Gonapodya prolifera JEL478]
MTQLDSIFSHVDQNSADYVRRLGEAVAIKSVSGDAHHRPEVVKMANYIISWMDKLGVSHTSHDPGFQELDGSQVKLPPIILGTYGTDPAKKTVLVYGHYDVQPALKSDGWTSDPFTLVEDEQGRLFGRGSTDDKAPILSWLWVIEAHQKLGVDLPVNIKMCFEGMEESGSEGLDELIVQEAKGYFKGTDYVCISDNYWLGKTRPCLTYGLRGIAYYKLTIAGPAKDLHSGVFGGTVHEPMTDLFAIMSKLVAPDGKILVPGIYDQVRPLTDKERGTYNGIDFALPDYEGAVGGKVVIQDNEHEVLMSRWRYPSLSLHGIEGAFYSAGAKTVIPAKVTGKFSIRLVPDMDPAEVHRLVSTFIASEHAKLNSKTVCTVEPLHGARAWLADPEGPSYAAASKAVQRVFGVKPDLTREGGSIPVTLTFQENLGVSVLLLPMGAADDGAHSINEKIDKKNYIEGIKLLATYLHEVASA